MSTPDTPLPCVTTPTGAAAVFDDDDHDDHDGHDADDDDRGDV